MRHLSFPFNSWIEMVFNFVIVHVARARQFSVGPRTYYSQSIELKRPGNMNRTDRRMSFIEIVRLQGS